LNKRNTINDSVPQSKVTKDSDEVNGFEIDAGGGLKQMLLPKKLDEESKVRNQDASIDK
jgi:hypothetical protein